MKPGKLYGVGVGPGAPDLMTLRSVERLRKADCIAIPRRDKFTPSVAWSIAEPNVGEIPGQERLFLYWPMTKNPEILKPAWEAAFKEIGARLYAGKSVAFISEGDPFIYSTFIYLYNHAKKNWTDVEVEVIPAVSSLSAVPVVADMPIADGEERIAVIPASYNTGDLRAILKTFDTVLLLKVSSVMPKVVEAIEAEGLLGRAVYVSKATMPQQKIVRDIASIKNDRCDYFSMVVVCKKDRSGILEGRAMEGLASLEGGT
jgi:precorrin-2/cobalt-factor-2 C20-methyltransferase